MNPAFMEGIAAAKAGGKILDNPYRAGYKGAYPAAHIELWDIGFIFELERQCGL